MPDGAGRKGEAAVGGFQKAAFGGRAGQVTKAPVFFRRKPLDKREKTDIIFTVDAVDLCKGSTTDSDSVCLGSNPATSTTSERVTLVPIFFEKISRPLHGSSFSAKSPLRLRCSLVNALSSCFRSIKN